MHRPVDQESIDELNARVRAELQEFAVSLRKSVLAAQPALDEFRRSMVKAAEALRNSLQAFGEALNKEILDDGEDDCKVGAKK